MPLGCTVVFVTIVSLFFDNCFWWNQDRSVRADRRQYLSISKKAVTNSFQ